MVAAALALAAVLAPSGAWAQARGRQDQGPAFCRNGQGHPVYGWQWCEQRGWGQRQARPRVTPNARRVPYPDRRQTQIGGFNNVAYDNGYADGYEKGLDDGRDNRSYDPVRHRWYRDADRRYEDRYGSRARYQNAYREAFRGGYDAGYRDAQRYDNNRAVRRSPWPF
jgi:hypothetical protein